MKKVLYFLNHNTVRFNLKPEPYQLNIGSVKCWLKTGKGWFALQSKDQLNIG